MSVSCIKQISNYLKVPVSKLSLNNDKMPTCNLNNKSVTGFVNIVLSLVNQSNSSLLDSNEEERCEIRQWLEYCMTYAIHHSNNLSAAQILQELNSALETRTYLVGYRLTIADVAVYYILSDLMEKLTYHQKENYLNFSRWFDNIQQNDTIRNKKPLVDFSTLFLTCVQIR